MLQEACLKRVYKLYYYNMNSSQNLLLFVHTAGRGGACDPTRWVGEVLFDRF